MPMSPLASVAIGNTTFMVIMWFFCVCVVQMCAKLSAEAFAREGLEADVQPALKIAMVRLNNFHKSKEATHMRF